MINRHIRELNIPVSCMSRTEIKKGITYIYGEREDINKPLYTKVMNDIFVHLDYIDKYTKEYFEKSIVNKDVYASLHYYGGYLPTFGNSRYHIVDKGELPPDNEYDYKKILYTDEKILADLYRNACKYQYNADADAFIRLTDKGAIQNSLKYYMQKTILNIGGNAYDRISDLSRIIIFLLSKVELTDDEKNIIMPLLEYSQSCYDLADVFNREKNIQQYVKHVKENPERYLNE